MFECTVIGAPSLRYSMEPSDAGTPENATNQGGERQHDQAPLIAGIPLDRTIRALLGVEAASFLLAAAIHAGTLVDGYQHAEATIAESVIGSVLLVGLAATWVRPRSTFSTAVAVQAFALLGTLVGIWTMIVGVGPRTVPDVVYHVAIVVVLLVGIGVAWPARGSEPT